jgi:alkylation response protein AidB-like acyl-CoA dehydrogenase
MSRELKVEDSIELDELRDSAKRVLGKAVDRMAIINDPAAARRLDGAQCKTMAELGWLALCVPQQRGGLGQPFTALGTLYRELGRALAGPSLLTAAISLDILAQAEADGPAGVLLEAAVGGELAVATATGGTGRLAVTQHGAQLMLDGTLHGLLGLGQASHLLVPVNLPEPAIALLALPHAGVGVTPVATWDITRGEVCRLRFDSVELDASQLVLRGAAAGEALARAQAHFDLALACDAVGAAEQLFEETLAYMQTRQQFNRVIASFQALKHRCADMKVAMEASRALVEASCAAFASGTGEWRAMAAASRIQAGSAFRLISEDAVQLHGGIGFTWEQSCHLFLKRARLNDVLGGSAEQRKDAVAGVLLRGARERAGSLLGHRVGEQ